MENREIPVLFETKENCCACGACLNICPKKAISMREDEHGFLYPEINKDTCIRCGMCKKVCAFQNNEILNSPIKCFAAVSADRAQAEKSASGGIFAAIATKTLERGGTVFGAAFDDSRRVHHISVDKQSRLCALQGSKYTQSDTETTYSEVKELLKCGKDVLYSGTPCQIAGLQGFLGKDYENLITVDIVCHGVPNNKMLLDYIAMLEEKHGGSLTSFTFRDKSIGWGINGSAKIGKKKITLWASASSYLYYFTRGWIYRENCYKCKYASSHRPADLTLGDFWGIEKQHPDYIGKHGWDESKGISLIIANTEKGVLLLEKLGEALELKPTEFDKIAAGNTQLRQPSKPGKREELLDAYKASGWQGLDKRFAKNMGWKKHSSRLKAMLPKGLKRALKRR